MADLSCKAKNCSFNEHEMCRKSDIQIGGKYACESKETNCKCFSENCNCEFGSSLCPEPGTTRIVCEAENCQHNDRKKCSAKHVDILGENANLPGETTCQTFHEK